MSNRGGQSEKESERLGSIALDQWRGFALILVLINHGLFFTGRVYGVGRVGVNLFFFISGILVFRSLAHSRATGEWARARLFWWRRTRRLYPALLAYVVAMGLLTLLLAQFPSLRPVANPLEYLNFSPVALTFLVNYEDVLPIHQPPSLAHLWSVGCEMQFYLLAPFLWVLATAREPRRFFTFTFALGVLVILGMAQPLFAQWKYHFEFSVWPMMFGLSCEYQRQRFLRIPAAWVTATLWSSIAICAAGIDCLLFGFEMKIVVIAVGALLPIPAFLAYLHGRPVPGMAGRFLEWLGVRTYSIYLWQQAFTICNFLPNLWHPSGAAFSAIVGAVWYRWFEYPFLSSSRRMQEPTREIA